MSYVVAIRKVATGEIRLARLDLDWSERSCWWWTGGSMSCDCNLEQKFESVVRDIPPDEYFDCGDERFEALYAELPDGTRIPLPRSKV